MEPEHPDTNTHFERFLGPEGMDRVFGRKAVERLEEDRRNGLCYVRLYSPSKWSRLGSKIARRFRSFVTFMRRVAGRHIHPF